MVSGLGIVPFLNAFIALVLLFQSQAWVYVVQGLVLCQRLAEMDSILVLSSME